MTNLATESDGPDAVWEASTVTPGRGLAQVFLGL